MANIGSKIDAELNEIKAKASKLESDFVNEYGKARQLIASNPMRSAFAISGASIIVGIIIGVLL